MAFILNIGKNNIGRKSLVRAMAVGAALLAATGCNKLRLGYEYVDWLVIYSVEDNFDLDKLQRSRFKEDVSGYFKWHRKSMLPVYAAYLDDVADSVRTGLKASQIDSGYARYESLRRQTLEPIIDKALVLLVSLTPDQIDGWMEHQKKKNQKLRKDFSGSLEEKLDHRAGKIIDEMEDWTGRLTADQKARIKVLNHTLPWNGILWLDWREKIEDRIADLLKKHGPQDELRHYLEDYYLHPEKLRSEEYQTRFHEFEIKLRIMILMIHNILTPQQKQQFITQVEKQAKDFRAMSAQE
jgi:hypothetical protein